MKGGEITMKKDNGLVIFMHDKNLIKQCEKHYKNTCLDFFLVTIFGFVLMFNGASLLTLGIWTISEIIFFSIMRLRSKYFIELLKFFQDDYIKNHPELPKDSSMLER